MRKVVKERNDTDYLGRPLWGLRGTFIYELKTTQQKINMEEKMEILKPKDTTEIVVKMNREQLLAALENLDESGADEIGIPLVKN